MDDEIIGFISLLGLVAAIGILITAGWMPLVIALVFGLVAGGIAAGNGERGGLFCGISGCVIIVFFLTLIPGFA